MCLVESSREYLLGSGSHAFPWSRSVAAASRAEIKGERADRYRYDLHRSSHTVLCHYRNTQQPCVLYLVVSMYLCYAMMIMCVVYHMQRDRSASHHWRSMHTHSYPRALGWLCVVGTISLVWLRVAFPHSGPVQWPLLQQLSVLACGRRKRIDEIA
jgi:hypothetical protein